MYISKIKKIYKMFNDVTPLNFDCGSMCGKRCCSGDENTGMYLLPGEEKLFEGKNGFSIKKPSDDSDFSVLICNGNCNREDRPFACRIYPFFPLRYQNEKIKVIFDPRAVNSCLIYGYSGTINKRFLKTVKKVGKMLNKDIKTSKYIDDISKMIYDIIDLNNIIYK